jgi:hypothetical protein
MEKVEGMAAFVIGALAMLKFDSGIHDEFSVEFDKEMKLRLVIEENSRYVTEGSFADVVSNLLSKNHLGLSAEENAKILKKVSDIETAYRAA